MCDWLNARTSESRKTKWFISAGSSIDRDTPVTSIFRSEGTLDIGCHKCTNDVLDPATPDIT